MNRHQRAADRMAEHLDHDGARRVREAERRAMQARISSAVSYAVKNEPNHLQLEAAKALVWNGRGQIASLTDEAGACAFMGSLAHTPVNDLGKAVAVARAEQLFTRAEGLQHVSIPLANVINEIADKVRGS